MCAEGQQISSDPENILIRSITQKRDKALGKGKEKAKPADKGKRVAEDNANSSVLKRPRDEAGPSGGYQDSQQAGVMLGYHCSDLPA